MAKRGKKGKPFIPETVVDEQGYVTDGMYRWGGPKKPYSPETLQAWANKFNSDFSKPATDRIAELKNYVSQLILPFADGPLTPEQAGEIRGRSMSYLRLPSEAGIYAYHKDLPDDGYWSDAADAIHELYQLEILLAEKPRKIDLIIRSAIRAGMIIKQAELRACFAHDVLTARKRRKASSKGGKATARFTKEVKAVALPIYLEFKRARLSVDAACQRTASKLKAEHGYEFSAKTVKRHLAGKKLDNA